MFVEISVLNGFGMFYIATNTAPKQFKISSSGRRSQRLTRGHVLFRLVLGAPESARELLRHEHPVLELRHFLNGTPIAAADSGSGEGQNWNVLFFFS